MQDTATSPAARQHLGHWSALIPEDLEMCREYQMLGDDCPQFMLETFQEPTNISRQAPETKRQNDQKAFLHVYN